MRLLLLAGTKEARDLTVVLRELSGLEVVASMAGATRAPLPLGVTTRIGGFGGRQGFEDYLRDHGIGAVLDATHPFAAAMSHRTVAVCRDRRLPHMQLLRAEWTTGPGDSWTEIAEEGEAAQHIPEGATVFVATGRQTLSRYGPMEGRRMMVRVIDAPDGPLPFADGGWLTGRPPFAMADEVTLFRKLGVDWLVVKNAGGDASRSKLDAARALGLPVAMIRRPVQPNGPNVQTVSAALDWVRGLG